MPDLTKATLNQQIVSMRKEVKKAVVHLVHALTTNISKLKNKNGTDDQKKKNKLKADRLINEIQVLRKLKPDNVSMFALAHVDEDELNRMLVEQEVERKSIVKLCLRQNMRKTVNDFVSKYQDSMDTLAALVSERLGNTEKTNKKKKKKPKKKQEQMKQEKIEETEIKSKSADINVDPEISLYDDLSNDSVESGPRLVIADPGCDNISRFDDSGSETEMSTDDDSEMEESTIESTEVEIPATNEVNTNLGKDKLVEKKNGELTNGKSRLELNGKNKTIGNIPSNNNKPSKKHVDPFFDNKYLTYCDVRNDENDSKRNFDDLERCSNSQNKWNNTGISKQRFNNKNIKRNYNPSFKKHLGVKGSNPFRDKRNNGFLNNKPNTNFSEQKQHPGTKGLPVKEEKLHPSWEAKKKLKQSSVQFQGKKITFDD